VSAEDLYQERIVRLAREAAGAGALDRPDGSATLDSPLCGDEVTIQVRLEEGKVTALAHRVRGCVLCQAAASIIGRAAPGATPGEIGEARATLAGMLERGAPAPEGRWGALSAFTPVAAVPSRRGCVLLPFDALAQALARAEERGRV
jgi:NifU-like protein involved in Fe-S cluster formation